MKPVDNTDCDITLDRWALPTYEEQINLIRSLGAPQFHQYLWTFINTRVAVDSVEQCCYTRNSARTAIVNIEWLATNVAPDFDWEDLDEEEAEYLARNWRLDPLVPIIINLDGITGYQLTPDQMPNAQMREDWFDHGRLPEHYAVCEAFDDFIYLLYCMRSDKKPSFNEDEKHTLVSMAKFLLPLLKSHAEILPAKLSMLDHYPTLRKHLRHQLIRHGIELSVREFDVCLATLAGKPAAQMAYDIGVQTSSVKTYVTRAFSKIGVKNKMEFFTWCFLSAGV